MEVSRSELFARKLVELILPEMNPEVVTYLIRQL
jgi:hypothetical protein